MVLIIWLKKKKSVLEIILLYKKLEANINIYFIIEYNLQ